MSKVRKPKRSDLQEIDVPAASLDQSIGYLVRRTFRTFTRALEHRLAEHGLSASMWFFLRSLWERDGQTQKELSEELGLRQPTTVSAMDNLERRGLIRRVRNLEDRRKTNIYLTEEGKILRKRLSKVAFEVNEVALHGFSPAETEQLQKLLARMTESVNADLVARGVEMDRSERG